MRLIDADALIEEMQNSKYTINDGAYARGANAVLDYYVREIPHRPTIAPASLRPKGEWDITDVDHAYGSKGYRCSECGEEEWRYDVANFCPNCGADMRGDKHD